MVLLRARLQPCRKSSTDVKDTRVAGQIVSIMVNK